MKTNLPSRCGKDVFVAVVPTSLHDFSGVRLVLFLSSIRQQTNVVVHVKVEERTRFTASFVDDEVVEGVSLRNEQVSGAREKEMLTAYVWDDQVLFYVHHVVHIHSSQLGELLTRFLEERGDGVTLLALERWLSS